LRLAGLETHHVPVDVGPSAAGLQFGAVTIVPEERLVLKDGQPVPLTSKTFDLLVVLATNPGRLLPKEELMQAVWGATAVEESNLSYHVFAIRKALGGTAENGHLIQTVPKQGYRFTAAVAPVRVRPRVTGGLPSASPAETNPESLRAGSSPAGSATNVSQASLARERLEHRVPSRRSWFSQRRVWMTVVGTLATALALAGQRWLLSPGAESLRAIPLTSLPGVVRSPSLSPDGNYAVFSWTGERRDNPDLYVQQIGGDAPLRLTTDPANDYGPAWSPDGRAIAFLRRGPAGPRSEIRLVPSLGGAERKIADIEPRIPFFKPITLSWCPDSTCVVVTDSPGVSKRDAVFVIGLDDGHKRQLTFPPDDGGLDVDPVISPDGRSLIFRRDTTPFSGSFYRLPLNGHLMADGEPVRLTQTILAGKATWMPDSREILYSADGALWRLDAQRGGVPRRLPFVGEDGLTPVVSRTTDGRQRLVYVRSSADANIWRVDTSAPGVPASSPPAAAIVSTRSDSIPSYSPDGHRVAFLSNRSGEWEIWVADPDGTNAVQLTSLGRHPGFPRWSADGTRIAFHGDPQGRPDVLVVPAAGGKPTILTTNVPNGGFPSFSRDGQWIYFCVMQDQQARIWKIRAAGGDTVQVTTNTGALAIESYDGRDLYYVEAADRPSSVWRLPLRGGTPVKVLDGVVLGNFDVVEGGIYYIDRVSGEAGAFSTDRPAGQTRLRYFDFGTRQSTTVAENLGAVGFGLSASRDGRTVFLSRIDSSVDELMRVENFR
jgi:eukaryotic-like serine/threonine-protein kinase